MDTASNRTCLARLPGGELQVLGAEEMDTIDVLRASAALFFKRHNWF